MQNQTISNSYHQDKIATKLQSKYRKILHTFFDRDFTMMPQLKSSCANNENQEAVKSLKIYSANSQHNLMRMIEEIKNAK